MAENVDIQQFRLWDKMRCRQKPLSFELEVTARCTNNCRHCYINQSAADKTAKRQELLLDEIAEVADEAVSLGALWCLVTGGDPLLRDDFCDLYLMLKKKGLLVSVFTNATLISRDLIELLRKYPPRDIEITVYGTTRDTYERVSRTSGSFNAFWKGVHVLLENGIKVRFKAMALRSNVDELSDIFSFCRDRTKDYFRFDPFLHLRYDGNMERNQEILSERLTVDEIVALEMSDPGRFRALQRTCDTRIDRTSSHQSCNHLFHCGAGNGDFSVSHQGLFRLCSSLCHRDCVYDLRNGTLTEAYRDFVPRVRDMRSSKKEYLNKCRTCAIVNLCMWCPARAHLETGELDEPVEYFCRVAHARAAMLQGRAPSSAPFQVADNAQNE